jgi:hypothetical protein
MKDVGHHQEPFGPAGPAPVAAVREELKERVEGLSRDSSARKELLAGDDLEDPFRCAARALVAVADRLLEKTARPVEEPSGSLARPSTISAKSAAVFQRS